MFGDSDEEEDVLAFGSTRTRRPMSRRVKGLIAAGGIVAAAATTCAVLAVAGPHAAAQTSTVTTLQQDSATQFQGPWSLDLVQGTVAHIARPGSGGTVTIGDPAVSYNPCAKPRR